MDKNISVAGSPSKDQEHDLWSETTFQTARKNLVFQLIDMHIWCWSLLGRQAYANKLFCAVEPGHYSQKVLKSSFDQKREYLQARPSCTSSPINSFTANQSLQGNWKLTVSAGQAMQVPFMPDPMKYLHKPKEGGLSFCHTDVSQVTEV